MTQEFLRLMLRVRRASVSVVAAARQEAGIITCRRGTMTVPDRTTIEATSCECYAPTCQEYDRLVWSVPFGLGALAYISIQ